MSEHAGTGQHDSGPGILARPVATPALHRSFPALRATTHPAGERLLTRVTGEMDLDSSAWLGPVLQHALDDSRTGVDLDLDGVQFCDCSGLNTLLRLRQEALHHGKTLTIRHSGPAVTRLLTLTGALSLFTSVPESSEA